MCRSDWDGRRAVQAGVDDPPADFDGGIVAEIVGGFENDPGRIQRLGPASARREPCRGARVRRRRMTIAFMADGSRLRSVVSLRRKRGLAPQARNRHPWHSCGTDRISRTLREVSTLRRPILAFQVVQVLGGDAVILGAEKQQRHGRRPRKVERLGQDQQHFPVPVQQGAFDHVARQCAQQATVRS